MYFLSYRNTKVSQKLTPAEIVGQILIARDDLEEWNKGAGEKAKCFQYCINGHG